jgi:hypothetical protein
LREQGAHPYKTTGTVSEASAATGFNKAFLGNQTQLIDREDSIEGKVIFIMA